MRFFTKFAALLLFVFSVFSTIAVNAQSILNPSDPVVTYSSSNPPTEPAWGQIGKWVRTRRLS